MFDSIIESIIEILEGIFGEILDFLNGLLSGN